MSARRSALGPTLLPEGSREPAESPHCPDGHPQRSENALDALLDELQTFSRPASQLSQVSCHHPQALVASQRPPNIIEIGRNSSVDSSCLSLLPLGQPGTLRRLHSYPSSSDTDTSPPVGLKQQQQQLPTQQESKASCEPSPKPPVPERNAELLQLVSVRRMPPPPPPRTSSWSPLASPTSPQLPPRNPTLRRDPPLLKAFSESNHCAAVASITAASLQSNNLLSASNSSSCESINSQEGLQSKKERQEQLEQRHQELLRKQRALQEQYARLQQLQRNAATCATGPPLTPPDLLKKTGSESNLLAKMGLGLSTATVSGSLSSLAVGKPIQEVPTANNSSTSKIYETDSL